MSKQKQKVPKSPIKKKRTEESAQVNDEAQPTFRPGGRAIGGFREITGEQLGSGACEIPLDRKPQRISDEKQLKDLRDNRGIGMEKRELQQRLEAAKSKVNAAMESAISAVQEKGDIGPACDEYTVAAKEFAKLILEERIRRYCDSMHMRDLRRASDSEHLDNLQKKEKVAGQIRDWLAPWGLGFCDFEHGAKYRLSAVRNPSPKWGTFCLSEYGTHGAKDGGSRTAKKITRWAEVVRIITDPQLCDITSFYGR